MSSPAPSSYLACAWSTAVCLVLGLTACHRADPPPPPPPAPLAAASAPVDQLAPGELLEGTEQAFGVKLPRGLRVEGSFATVVYATGSLKASDVVNYLRARVTGGSVHVGAAATILDQVTAPSEPTRPLQIHVEPLPRNSGTRVEFRDATPPRGMPSATDEERWRAAGFSADGKILDPTHLH